MRPDVGLDATVDVHVALDATNPTDTRMAGDLGGDGATLVDLATADVSAAVDVETADAGADAQTPLYRDPFPSTLVDAVDLQATGFGTVTFVARDGNELRAFIYRATSFADRDGPILFVMHGSGRTAESYLRAAAPLAERRGALAIAVEFDELRYPTSESFALGVGVGATPDGPTYVASEWRATDDTTFAEIEHLFEAVRTTFNGRQPGYYLFGHSAGAQFTHRLLTFLPQARVIRAVAANAGWYTLPRAVAGDPNYAMPYGLSGTPVAADSARIVGAPLTVLAGSRDVLADADLRQTSEARAQGEHRLARAQFYVSAGEQEATALNAPFGWRGGVVPLAGHDKDEVMPSADFYLFESATTPCSPSADITGLVFNEIHADPDPVAGDANADGTRDASDDEFVELVNTSTTTLCLTGWSLGDLSDDERHVFPIGSELAPGQAIVVFGGGVPVGDFGLARVQWAAYGGQLDLTNSGEVLSLRDPGGIVRLAVSWGDCGTQDCAVDHIGIALNSNVSIVREPELVGGWRPHPAPNAFSAGTRADGSPL